VAKAVELTTQPAGAQDGIPLLTQPAGRLVDGSGVLSRTSDVTITASKASGTGDLSGTLTQDTVEGVFAFTDLTMSAVAGSITLGFAASGLVSATSDSFNVNTTYTVVADSGAWVLTGTELALSYSAGLYPNEPAGMTAAYTVNNFDTLPPLDPSSADSFGWRRYLSGNAENTAINIAAGYTDGCSITLGTDATYGDVLQVNYPIGSRGGYSPSRALAGTGFTTKGGSSNLKTRLYLSTRVKMSANWSTPNPSTKMVFPRGPVGSSQNHVIMLHRNDTGVEDYSPRISLQAGGGGREITIASPVGTYGLGVWHHLEVYLVQNTGGNADGIAKLWVNGNLEINVSDVAWVAESEPHAWDYLWLDPTFGGGTGNSPVDQYFQLDGWYISLAD